ncbi:hypothetical protein ACFL3C_04440 [Patescibacteria group bacterium]
MTEDSENTELVPEEKGSEDISLEISRQAILREAANHRIREEIRNLGSTRNIALFVAMAIATIAMGVGIGDRARTLHALVKEHRTSGKLAKAQKEKAIARRKAKEAEDDKRKADRIIEKVKSSVEICSKVYDNNSGRWNCLAWDLKGIMKVKTDATSGSLDNQIRTLEGVIESSRRRISRIKDSVAFCGNLVKDEDYDYPDAHRWGCFKSMESELVKPRKKRGRSRRKLRTRRRKK